MSSPSTRAGSESVASQAEATSQAWSTHRPALGAAADQFGASDLSHTADGFDPRMHETVTDPRHPIHPLRRRRVNPAASAHRAAPPFLLLHGDDDRIIAAAQTGLLIAR
jgi:dipeptidyl aminopeptidase/acylaminoacyl peptidase